MIFGFAHKHWSRGLFPEKTCFKKLMKTANLLSFVTYTIVFFSGNKPINQRLSASAKNTFVCLIFPFVYLLISFPCKNVKMAYFDQHLEWVCSSSVSFRTCLINIVWACAKWHFWLYLLCIYEASVEGHAAVAPKWDIGFALLCLDSKHVQILA